MISDEAKKIKSTLIRDTLDDTPIAEKRRAWEDSVRLMSIPDDVHNERLSISDVPCMLHTPKDFDGTDEIIVYIHGGGLVEGSVATSCEWCSRLGSTAKQPVLSIDYRLAPEYAYPAALEDIVNVCLSIQREEDFSAMSSIGADSTGCVLALQALVHLRDKGAPLPSSCFLLSPSIDLTFSSFSMEKNAESDLLVSKDVLEHYARLYAGEHSLGSPEISPLFAALHDLPPILVHIDDSELLLDDAKRLESLVRRSNGSIHIVVTRELWHVWPTWGDFPEARAATDQIIKHIRSATQR